MACHSFRWSKLKRGCYITENTAGTFQVMHKDKEWVLYEYYYEDMPHPMPVSPPSDWVCPTCGRTLWDIEHRRIPCRVGSWTEHSTHPILTKAKLVAEYQMIEKIKKRD